MSYRPYFLWCPSCQLHFFVMPVVSVALCTFCRALVTALLIRYCFVMSVVFLAFFLFPTLPIHNSALMEQHNITDTTVVAVTTKLSDETLTRRYQNMDESRVVIVSEIAAKHEFPVVISNSNSRGVYLCCKHHGDLHSHKGKFTFGKTWLIMRQDI